MRDSSINKKRIRENIAARDKLMKINESILALSFIVLFISTCDQKPADIHYGSDECVHCKMMIYDNRFASQIVSATGKSLKFDAIECMATYTESHKSELKDGRFWFSNFSNPGQWIELDQAMIIKSEVIRSPMGASLLALENDWATEQHFEEYPGKLVEWKTLVK